LVSARLDCGPSVAQWEPDKKVSPDQGFNQPKNAYFRRRHEGAKNPNTGNADFVMK
jgi:hypothetical protein